MDLRFWNRSYCVQASENLLLERAEPGFFVWLISWGIFSLVLLLLLPLTWEDPEGSSSVIFQFLQEEQKVHIVSTNSQYHKDVFRSREYTATS